MVNRVTQSSFSEHAFDGSGFNLHCRPAEISNTLVVFVHGFGGRGYGTWDRIPQQLYDGAQDTTTVDVGIFQYPSGFRQLPGLQNRFDFWSQRLCGVLYDVEDAYDHIFLVGHSLGGLLIEYAAMQFLQSSAMSGAVVPTPLAALLVIASPRAGTVWALPPLQPLLPELRVLRRLSPHQARIDRFFGQHVERLNVAESAAGRTVLPEYAALGGRDRVVNGFSATFAVPERQQKRLEAGHSSIVRPPQHDAALISWIRRTVKERLEVRAQATRHAHHTANRPPSYVGPVRPSLIARLLSDTTGSRWEKMYNDARRAATTSDVVVHDWRDAQGTKVDLIIGVFNSRLVLAQASSVRTSIHDACVELRSRPTVWMGVSPVGDNFQAAEATVNAWVIEEAVQPSVYVEGVATDVELRGLIARWLQLVIDRDPRRRASDAVRASLREDQYGYSGEG